MLAHQGVLGELVSQHLLPTRKIGGQSSINRYHKQNSNSSNSGSNNANNSNANNQQNNSGNGGNNSIASGGNNSAGAPGTGGNGATASNVTTKAKSGSKASKAPGRRRKGRNKCRKRK